jgi:hypothetical protein
MIKKKISKKKHGGESPLNSTARILSQALSKAAQRSTMSPTYCESLSAFLNKAYSTRNRAFHNISHAHDVAAVTSGSGTAQLAALFHDVVYFQIDWTNRKEITGLFAPFFVTRSHSLKITKIKNNPWAEALIQLFGFNDGDQIFPSSGLNEFLSAWIAIQKLQGKVSPLNLLKVSTCIQATIPLWAAVNARPMEVPFILKRNLERAIKTLKLRAPEGYVEEAIAEAVEMANLDVMSFAYLNPRNFLYNSWALVGESNPSLQGALFTVTQFKEAIAKMEGFFSILKPTSIFRQFNHEPTTHEMKQLQKSAEQNLKIGSLYILLRLVDTCMIESIALLTGGDAPLEMFIGPKASRRESDPATISRFLNYKILRNKGASKSSVVLDLLSTKSAFRSAFDSKGAPLAAYLYERMSQSDCEQAITAVRKYIANEISPSDYLTLLRSDLVLSVINAIAKIAFTRKDSLEDLARNFRLLQKHAA